MSRFVLDASVALTWCFEDEASPETDALLDELTHGSALVPMLWHQEMWNILTNAERKGRISAQNAYDFLVRLRLLPIETDFTHPDKLMMEVLRSSRIYGLTSYDATYLVLALRHHLPLATRDRELADAAMQRGVKVLPAR